MGTASVWHWAVILVTLAICGLVFMVPVAQILRKAGFSPWLSLVMTVPVANLVGLWVFAFVDWPSLRRDDA